MSPKVLICTATEMEMKTTFPQLAKKKLQAGLLYDLSTLLRVDGGGGQKRIFGAVTGVGISHTMMYLTNILNTHDFEVILNLGICGAYPDRRGSNHGLKVGDIVQISKDVYGDVGSYDKRAKLLNYNTLGFSGKFEYTQRISKEGLPLNIFFENYAQVHGVTVNACTGTREMGIVRAEEYGAQVETMEGAAVFQAAEFARKDVIQVRAVSNIASTRDFDAWDIPGALGNLRDALQNIGDAL